VPILPHETKALLKLFCLPLLASGKIASSSSHFVSWGKIHDSTLADQDWIGLMIFKNFASHQKSWLESSHWLEWRYHCHSACLWNRITRKNLKFS